AATGCLIASTTRPKRCTRLLFAPAFSLDESATARRVLIVADKFGDVWSWVPSGNQSSAASLEGRHLLGHTSATITCMATTHDGRLLLTGDRVERVRVSHFPNTCLIKSYLLRHTDFVAAVTAVSPPATLGRVSAPTLVATAGGDGMVGLWDASTGDLLSWLDVR
ncbi:unnamed protein product, partial [Phaeothamnion confervicola]